MNVLATKTSGDSVPIIAPLDPFIEFSIMISLPNENEVLISMNSWELPCDPEENWEGAPELK